jgi:thiol-disulfide isomerase/thioredoxin
MKRRLFLVVAALGALGPSGCVKRDALPSLVNNFRQGDQVNLVLPQYPNGTPHDLVKDRGSVVLLDIWATWCEPCRDALPIYQDLAKHYEAKGLRVYAINMDEDPRQIGPFLQEVKVSLPILLEQDGLVEKSLGVKLMPTTFLLDKQGRLRHRHEGFAEEFLQKYQNEIEALLAEP